MSGNNYAFLIGELPFSFHHLVQFSILLVLTASLLLVTFVKVMLSQPDFLDRLLALLTVAVFFVEQLTR